ncbi:MAG: hypothetical protein UR31_C0008G0031 [Parcubacteria group bacterium GW2011_GWA2_33_14]|uniref:Metallo-beta-lactamase domain-containing protein n=1 Tax=Candidatus Staskawiczbacteria bacterium RIFCSPHIGHO2_02_FULL_33_16 TaxID=1802204 RepID=A0A1G2HVT5_9BACT|nr:MAG: hypothetical protein UR31_C0008G0031 [Parcubacteria group bacterium GW2011_GWA2_33_14]OGZ65958.1 MAG: hypothetical protein A3D34_01670 [Candidatus Staskawiczbacteria bacterium RIFCSPHIGHO2_02_FULL_33_16]OGZ70545.1 MAG: hypothetical protein A2980_01180 [Candidatus Staskawiczbacteria bacterium RIFCSPLOWO2_01_FULL_33_13]
MISFLTLRQKIFLGIIAILFLLNIFAWQEVIVLAGPQYLKVNFLDVGQGDSIFIQTPDRHQILIDGGPDSLVLGKLQKSMPLWDRSLNVVILTHPDSDHLAGLLYVLQKYKIDYFVWTGIVRDGQQYQKLVELLQLAQKRGTKIIQSQLGQKIMSGGVVISTLNPIEAIEGKYFKDSSNESGIVSYLSFGKNSFLFTADIGLKTEKMLISNSSNLNAEVLKVGHHGSKYSTSEEFLQAVSPNLAVISVGKDNFYGHPTQEVLQRLQNFGINTFRTDQDGDIQIISDGNNIKVIE